MSKKFKQGVYIPINKEKYFHSKTKMNENLKGIEYPVYRSSWELKFFKFCDLCEKVEKWTSEPFGIKYFNPIKNKNCNYYPDALMTYNNKTFLVEIKPKSQIQNGKTLYDKLSQTVNEAKWKSAKEFCNEKGYEFIILNDDFFK